MFSKFSKNTIIKNKKLFSSLSKNKKALGATAIIVPTFFVASLYGKENSFFCKEEDKMKEKVKELEKENKALEKDRKNFKSELKDLKKEGVRKAEGLKEDAGKKIKEGAEKLESKAEKGMNKLKETVGADRVEKLEKKAEKVIEKLKGAVGADKVEKVEKKAETGIEKLKGAVGADKVEKMEKKAEKGLEKAEKKVGAENIEKIEKTAERGLVKAEQGIQKVKEVGIRHPYIVSGVAGALSAYAIQSFGKVMIIGAAITFFGVKYIENYGYAKFNWEKLYNKEKNHLLSTITNNPGTTAGFTAGMLAAFYLRQRHFSIIRNIFTSTKKPLSS